jgi:hypothetical protein
VIFHGQDGDTSIRERSRTGSFCYRKIKLNQDKREKTKEAIYQLL